MKKYIVTIFVVLCVYVAVGYYNSAYAQGTCGNAQECQEGAECGHRGQYCEVWKDNECSADNLPKLQWYHCVVDPDGKYTWRKEQESIGGGCHKHCDGQPEPIVGGEATQCSGQDAAVLILKFGRSLEPGESVLYTAKTQKDDCDPCPGLYGEDRCEARAGESQCVFDKLDCVCNPFLLEGFYSKDSSEQEEFSETISNDASNGSDMIPSITPVFTPGPTLPPDATPPPGDGTPPPGDGTPPPGDGTPPPGDATPPPICVPGNECQESIDCGGMICDEDEGCICDPTPTQPQECIPGETQCSNCIDDKWGECYPDCEGGWCNGGICETCEPEEPSEPPETPEPTEPTPTPEEVCVPGQTRCEECTPGEYGCDPCEEGLCDFNDNSELICETCDPPSPTPSASPTPTRTPTPTFTPTPTKTPQATVVFTVAPPTNTLAPGEPSYTPTLTPQPPPDLRLVEVEGTLDGDEDPVYGDGENTYTVTMEVENEGATMANTQKYMARAVVRGVNGDECVVLTEMGRPLTSGGREIFEEIANFTIDVDPLDSPEVVYADINLMTDSDVREIIPEVTYENNQYGTWPTDCEGIGDAPTLPQGQSAESESGETNASVEEEPDPVTPQSVRANMLCLGSIGCATGEASDDAPCEDYIEDSTSTEANESIKVSLKYGQLDTIGNRDFYIVECINGLNGPCSSGDNNIDQKLGLTGPASLAGSSDINYAFLNYRDVASNQSENPPQHYSVQEVGGLENEGVLGIWRSQFPPDHDVVRSMWAVPNPEFDENIRNPDNISQVQGTFEVGTGDYYEICVGIRWDPYGRVFDGYTLEPIEDVSVNLLYKDQGGNYRQATPPLFEGIQNPYITKENGYFNFFVPDGTYRLTASHPQYTFPAQRDVINPQYSELYDNPYFGEDIVQKGVPQRRNIPMIPNNLAQSEKTQQENDVEIMSVNQGYNPETNEYLIEGIVSHPLATVSVYGTRKEGNGNETRTRQLAFTLAEQSGSFTMSFNANQLDKGELVGEIQAVKKRVYVPLTLKYHSDNVFMNAVYGTIDAILSRVSAEDENDIDTRPINHIVTTETLRGTLLNENGDPIMQETPFTIHYGNGIAHSSAYSDVNGRFNIKYFPRNSANAYISYTTPSGQGMTMLLADF